MNYYRVTMPQYINFFKPQIAATHQNDCPGRVFPGIAARKKIIPPLRCLPHVEERYRNKLWETSRNCARKKDLQWNNAQQTDQIRLTGTWMPHQIGAQASRAADPQRKRFLNGQRPARPRAHTLCAEVSTPAYPRHLHRRLFTPPQPTSLLTTNAPVYPSLIFRLAGLGSQPQGNPHLTPRPNAGMQGAASPCRGGRSKRGATLPPPSPPGPRRAGGPPAGRERPPKTCLNYQQRLEPGQQTNWWITHPLQTGGTPRA